MTSFEYEYFNLSVNNIDSETADEMTHEPDLVFSEVRDGPIIENTQEYDFSIENFKLDLKSLPVFIPTIRSNFELSADADVQLIQRNTTIYTVGIEYLHPSTGIRYIGYSRIIFQPQDMTKICPNFTDGYPNYKSGYYNIYNYEYFIARCINPAIINAILALKNVLSSYGIDSSFIKDNAPYMIFDKATQIMSLNAPVETFNGLTGASGGSFLSIIFNKPLYRLINTLPMTIQKGYFKTLDADGVQETVSAEGFKLNLNNFGLVSSTAESHPPQLDGSVIEYTSNAPDYLVVYQDYSTFDSWSPVESIVFTSSTIPVKSSMRSANHSYINGIETTKGSTNIIELELTDFKSGNYSGGIIYNPTEKRWINLLQTQELRRISVNVYYRSKLNGDLVPIQLNSGGSFSMKMVFRKPKYF